MRESELRSGETLAEAIMYAQRAERYDALRTRLIASGPPELRMFSVEQEDALQLAKNDEDPTLVAKGEAVRRQVEVAWRDRVTRELESISRITVHYYDAAARLADRDDLRDERLTNARQRLQELEGELDPASFREIMKMRLSLTASELDQQ